MNSDYLYQIGLTERILLVGAITLLLVIFIFNIDFKLADFIYHHLQWRMKKTFFFDTLMHRFSRYVLILIYLIILGHFIAKVTKKDDLAGAYHLLILLITIGTSVLWVTTLKRILEVDCPWDLLRYGGEKPFFSLFNYPVSYLPSAHCFPASHASVGFSWLAVFFYFKATKQINDYKTLGLILFIGVCFGIGQQLRGAHFISHDVWSFIICWTNAIVIYKFAYRKNRVR